MFPHLVRASVALALALAPAPALQAQDRRSDGFRESMWPAPTAEDWQRPCLVTWQRSFDDARAVARATGKPILVCVNMDGEIASEHYAGIRYRRPETAALYEPYVCVIASVYRHTPRDHDETGRRILCPRFGSVTCGEHIAIEPGLYDEFFEGRRIAPRHIGVELDGQEMYDVFYAWDTDTIFDTLREGITNRRDVPVPPEQGDLPLVERVSSPDVRDREAVEQSFREGTRAQRLALMEAALAAGPDAPVELLRLAALGSDPQLIRMARGALSSTRAENAVDLIVEVLAEPMATEEQDALIAALERLGASSPRAATLAVVHRGLVGRSESIDAEGWREALREAGPAAPVLAPEALDERLANQDAVLASDDAQARLELAEAFLVSAAEQFSSDPKSARLLFLDARATARQAEELGASGWRLRAALAVAGWYLDDTAAARTHALAAVEGGLPTGAQDWNTMVVLSIFAQARQEAIREALGRGAAWPPQWLADVHAACSVLARHPHGTDEQIAAYHDFLLALGAAGPAGQVLDEGLVRFPGSWALHARLRRHLLVDEGLVALEQTYARLIDAPDAHPDLLTYAGYASRVAAEFHRRAGNEQSARAAYERALAYYERDAARHPDRRERVDGQVALVLAGLARVAYESGQDDAATELLLASLERSADVAATQDGLNISAVDTAMMLLARVRGANRGDLVERLEASLAELAPELLRLPAYERELPAEPPGDA